MGTNKKYSRDKILDVADALFVKHGFDATSLRTIAETAAVNLAATHYHFGSKLGLFETVILRTLNSVNESRIQRLDAIESDSAGLEIQNILRAYFEPVVDFSAILGSPFLLGRGLAEAKALGIVAINDAHELVVDRFLGAKYWLSFPLSTINHE